MKTKRLVSLILTLSFLSTMAGTATFATGDKEDDSNSGSQEVAVVTDVAQEHAAPQDEDLEKIEAPKDDEQNSGESNSVNEDNDEEKAEPTVAESKINDSQDVDLVESDCEKASVEDFVSDEENESAEYQEEFKEDEENESAEYQEEFEEDEENENAEGQEEIEEAKPGFFSRVKNSFISAADKVHDAYRTTVDTCTSVYNKVTTAVNVAMDVAAIGSAGAGIYGLTKISPAIAKVGKGACSAAAVVMEHPTACMATIGVITVGLVAYRASEVVEQASWSIQEYFTGKPCQAAREAAIKKAEIRAAIQKTTTAAKLGTGIAAGLLTIEGLVKNPVTSVAPFAGQKVVKNRLDKYIGKGIISSTLSTLVGVGMVCCDFPGSLPSLVLSYLI